MDTSASPTPAPPEVRTETCTLVPTDEFRTASASVTVTSRGRNGARAVRPVHTVPPVYCGFVTVAVTVTSQSCVTGGAVHCAWNLPLLSVTPVVGLRVPAVPDSETDAPWTAAPDESETATWTVVDPSEGTDLENECGMESGRGAHPLLLRVAVQAVQRTGGSMRPTNVVHGLDRPFDDDYSTEPLLGGAVVV